MSQEQTKSLILVDDHEMLMFGLKTFLESKSDWKVTGMAKSISSAKKLLESVVPQIIIIDVELDKESGFDLASYMQGAFPEVKIIMYSMHEENDFIFKARQMKVNGYLSKSSDSEEFLDCINAVYSGKTYIEEKLAQNQNVINETLDILTNREALIFKEMIQGKNNKEIADSLKLGKHSVEVYATTIYEKTFCANRAEFLMKFRLPSQN